VKDACKPGSQREEITMMSENGEKKRSLLIALPGIKQGKELKRDEPTL